MSSPEFVAIGHVTLDRFGGATRPGGAALYAAVTAHRLGLSVGLLTSHADDFPLDAIPPAIEVVTVPARDTTAFEHRDEDEGRVILVEATAEAIGTADLPEDWRDAPTVLLAPVAAEVDPLLATQFVDATVGAAVQGWLRRQSDADGRVGAASWTPPAWLLDRVAAMFMSVDDVRGLEDDVTEWLQRLPIAVLTAGRDGALLYVSGDRYEIPAIPAEAIDATGAGDVFAATFLVRHHLGDDPWEAARAATCAAGLSVCGIGWSSVPDRRALVSALADYRRLRDAAP